ncbi:MAG: elongation factor P maturation arginine rhamnosyltransferase EarP [Burkholderiaceae bacterium]|nr:MAG: elongation factor P maturation arginine rhamnosyltransferase EarP [Burkholderiaceae bacterium]
MAAVCALYLIHGGSIRDSSGRCARHNCRVPQSPSFLWDLFCRVVDNYGDVGVCWRLARVLAARGQRVRLWLDDASALTWMAPEALSPGVPGVRVLPWSRPLDPVLLANLPRADVWVEAFGCELPSEFLARGGAEPAAGTKRPCWLNLEYLSAEAWVERMHGLPSPVLAGPARGATKWFFYPGFTPGTGGLLCEDDLFQRQDDFDRAAWLAGHDIPWRGECLLSLFCYEPPVLAQLLRRCAQAPRDTRILVTAGRAAAAFKAALASFGTLPPRVTVSWLPYLTQDDYDALLWSCDANFVRGEDSLVRALWAGQPFVWQPYPQDDGAHANKLSALLDWLDAPADLRRFHAIWSGLDTGPLPTIDASGWRRCVRAARERLRAQADLATQLTGFVQQKI